MIEWREIQVETYPLCWTARVAGFDLWVEQGKRTENGAYRFSCWVGQLLVGNEGKKRGFHTLEAAQRGAVRHLRSTLHDRLRRIDRELENSE